MEKKYYQWAHKESREKGNAIMERDKVEHKNLVMKKQKIMKWKNIGVGFAGGAKKIFFSFCRPPKQLNYIFRLRSRHISIYHRSEVKAEEPRSFLNQLTLIHSFVLSMTWGRTTSFQILFLISFTRMIHYDFLMFPVCSHLVRKIDENHDDLFNFVTKASINCKFTPQVIFLCNSDNGRADKSAKIQYFYHWCTISSI